MFEDDRDGDGELPYCSFGYPILSSSVPTE